MSLMITADMEGISGVVHTDHVNPSHAEHARFRRIMTADVNAAIAGARAAGMDELAVDDGQWDGTNILLEELNPQARLNSGNSAPFFMVVGIQSGVDAVFFIGYHARAGSVTGILDHTHIQIVSGLKDGDRVVTVGKAALRDGGKVQIVEANAL